MRRSTREEAIVASSFVVFVGLFVRFWGGLAGVLGGGRKKEGAEGNSEPRQDEAMARRMNLVCIHESDLLQPRRTQVFSFNVGNQYKL